MQLLFCFLRILMTLCPGCVKILEPARVSRDAVRSSRQTGSPKKVIFLPFLGWLEVDAESITNRSNMYDLLTKKDRQGSPPEDPAERLRT